LGNSTINVSLARSHNAIVEPKLKEDSIEEVLMTSLEDMAQPLFDDEHFIEEVEELVHPIELDLNNNRETPVIISDKLFQEETHRLVTVLERHRLAIGYSLHDLIGISPVLCTYRIPTDPDISSSREPQRRLNNAMCEVFKKEVLKHYQARIIYPLPHSEWVSPVQVVPKKEGMAIIKNEKNELIP
jgi:hypothetical protein